MISSVEREVTKEIMRTDVFVKIVSEEHPQEELKRDLDTCFSMFRAFEARFSRFIPGNELSVLNAAEEISVSPELFDMLSLSVGYHRGTGGIFDPGIFRILVSEGYGESFGALGFGTVLDMSGDRTSFGAMELDRERQLVRKPAGLKIDLGGIGKGYIVDQVVAFLRVKYRHFVVDAGGDMYCAGADALRGLDAWAIEVEDPADSERSLAMLALSDRAVATSGTNRRKWATGTGEKSHLIDPKEGKSVTGDIVSVTVVADSTTDADVYAKVLLIMGAEKGMIFADRERLAALFAMRDGSVRKNGRFDGHIWKNI